MKKIRVLFLLTYYHPHWTGLSGYAKRLAEGLSERGYLARVLTTRHLNALKEREVVSGVEVTRKRVWGRISRSVVAPGLWIEMVKAISEVDQVVVFLPMFEAIWAVELARFMKKKVILVHNGDLVLPKGWLNRILERFYYWSGDWVVRRSDATVIHTEDYARNSKLLSKHQEKWRVIETPTKIFPLQKELTEKLKRRINSKGAVVGFAGRWVEEKGFDILLKAGLMVKKRLKDVRFVFAGETKVVYEAFWEKCEYLVEEMRGNLVTVGLLSPDEMPSFYSLCDVFVVSSRSDCFPTTQIEAMLCGVPIVVTDIPGARYLVQKTGMGEIVKPEDPIDLARGIEKVIVRRNVYTKYKSRVEEIFNYKKLIDKYEKVLLG